MAPRKRASKDHENELTIAQKRARTVAYNREKEDEEAQKLIAAGAGQHCPFRR